MFYREYAPHEQLQNCIESFWIAENPTSPLSQGQPVVPDGRIDWIFNFGGPCGFIDGGKNRVIGKQTGPLVFRPEGALRLIGVRFRPGGFYPFVDFPLYELPTGAIEGASVFGAWGRELESRLSEARTDEELKQIVNQACLQRLQKGRPVDPITVEAVRLLASSRGRISIDHLKQRLGLSYRTLDRRFETTVGVSPKMLGRYIRFLNVLSVLHHERFPGWANIAHDFGFSDQSHLIREFKQLTGKTPLQFVGEESWLSALQSEPERMSNFFNTGSGLRQQNSPVRE